MAFSHIIKNKTYDKLGDVMLKKMMYRKIVVVSSILIVMLMLYLIPDNNKVKVQEKLEYVYPNDMEVVYLLDEYDNLSRVSMSVFGDDILDKVNNLLDILTISGKRHDIIPNGFRPLIPKGCRVIDANLNNGVLIINFSKEFYNVDKDNEEKLIETLVYTLTSIDGIDKIKIKVDSNDLLELPNSKKKMPEYLDKSYGINKEYELTSLSDVDSYTVYYVLNYNDDIYYTPVTKYINNSKQDKVKVIIDELATSITYQSNLMSYLDSQVKLLDYEIGDDSVRLNFNEMILSDIANNVILEEVMYTIGLSICDEFMVDSVIFEVDNKEISTFSLKTLEKY